METKGILFNGWSWTARIYEKEKHKHTHIGSYKSKEEAIKAKREYINIHYPEGYSGDDYHARFHGMWGTRIYWIWHSMLCRCENPNHSHYSYYGGKGIIVCKEWHKFPIFLEWALSSGYKENLTIDRKDGNKGYKPSNCRWATRSEQVINRPKRSDCCIQKNKNHYSVNIRRNNIRYYGGCTTDLETARRFKEELLLKLSNINSNI